jgi:uncharacterized protein
MHCTYFNGAKLMNKRIYVLITVFAAIVLSLPLISGCNSMQERLQSFNERFEAADFNSAADSAKKHFDKNRKNPDNDDLLWVIQAAAAKRSFKDYNSSTKYFDKAEDYLKFYDLRWSGGDQVAAMAINDTVIPYQGQQYDRVMVNTYKALNFMAQGNFDLARVEFNRAIDRQRRTKEVFEKEIRQEKEKLDKSQYGSLAKSTLSDPKLGQALHDKYPEIDEYQAYSNYVNPFVTYLASVYFNGTGQPSEARDLLKETTGLVPENQSIAQEFTETEKLLASNGTFKNTVWVIFENGVGPIREEFRIDLPIFIATNRVFYAGIALPKLKYRDAAVSSLQIDSDGTIYNTSVVCNMDRVIHSEFKRDFDAALFRAVVSTTAKVIAQYALTSQGSSGANLLAIGVAAYSFMTNDADIRIWTALPKDFQFARLPKPQNNILKITPANCQTFDIQLPNCNNVLVYIKIVQRNAKPVYEIIPLR